MARQLTNSTILKPLLMKIEQLSKKRKKRILTVPFKTLYTNDGLIESRINTDLQASLYPLITDVGWIFCFTSSSAFFNSSAAMITWWEKMKLISCKHHFRYLFHFLLNYHYYCCEIFYEAVVLTYNGRGTIADFLVLQLCQFDENSSRRMFDIQETENSRAVIGYRDILEFQECFLLFLFRKILDGFKNFRNRFLPQCRRPTFCPSRQDPENSWRCWRSHTLP